MWKILNAEVNSLFKSRIVVSLFSARWICGWLAGWLAAFSPDLYIFPVSCTGIQPKHLTARLDFRMPPWQFGIRASPSQAWRVSRICHPGSRSHSAAPPLLIHLPARKPANRCQTNRQPGDSRRPTAHPRSSVSY